MIAVLTSWSIILLVTLTGGDLLTGIYNRVCKTKESYNLVEKFILGLCAVSILITPYSLWLPAGKLFLPGILAASCLYWIINRKKLVMRIAALSKNFANTSPTAKWTIAAFTLVILASSLWAEGVYDSLFYHHQNIRWNEEYAAVPGLGNLDDRFAFNSNYLLISAVFTLRFIFGEAQYSLIPLSFAIIGAWIIKEVVTSRFDRRKTIALIAFCAFTIHSIYFIFDTSTDLLPNLICLYMALRIALDSNFVKNNSLFIFLIPVFLITCKLSTAPFIILSAYIAISAISDKKRMQLAMLIVLATLVILPWLARNVIVSGYLAYPMASIDLFDADWKIPAFVAHNQLQYIHDIGLNHIRIAVLHPTTKYRDPLWINIITTSICTAAAAALLFALRGIIAGKRPTSAQYTLLAALVISIIMWAVSGPDIRFISGILIAFIAVSALLFGGSGAGQYLRKMGICTLAGFLIITTAWTTRRLYNGYKITVSTEALASAPAFSSILIRPYSEESKVAAYGIDTAEHFDIHPIGKGITIYVSDLMYTLEVLPSTVEDGLPGRSLSIDCLEARGNSLQDGFRTKEICNK